MLRLKMLVFIGAVLIQTVSAQSIGINATGSVPDTSAALDIDFPDKGLLIPRVGLVSVTDLTTIKLPATGLMVYNTNGAITGGNGVGFYFYNGSGWNQAAGTAGNWGLKGNSNTIAGTNFIGTSDGNDLVIKTSGNEAMRVAAGGNVGIGTVSPTAKFSVGSSSQFQVNGSGNITKINNIAISFPAAQGGAATQLTNDGSGNLSWSSGTSVASTFVLTLNLSNMTLRDAEATNIITPFGYPVNWTAPKSGTILVTLYKIAPYCFSCAGGHLGFGFRLNGNGNNLNFITSISRFSGGDIVYAPILETFSVTAGTVYEISAVYLAQYWSSCMLNIRGNSSGNEYVKIEYIQ